MHNKENKTAVMILKSYYSIFNVKNPEFKSDYRTEAVCVKVADNSVFSQSGFVNSSVCMHISASVATMIETFSQLVIFVYLST